MMCTAISLNTSGHYFGRTLDLDSSYGEQVCILPRYFPLPFRQAKTFRSHYAIIGMAVVAEGYPLFYDGANEKGLCIAGLNFPENAHYFPTVTGKENITPYEFIPWILSQCATAAEVQYLLERVNLLDEPLSKEIPLAPLHWLISDHAQSLVVESTADGLHIYENPAGVLTNNPPFPFQKFQLNNFRHLRPDTPPNTFSHRFPLEDYCLGLGGIGLPGDLSSMSRFQRAVFHLENSCRESPEVSPLSQFFHLMDTVTMPLGSCRTDDETWDYTVYTCCIQSKTGQYFYTTYEDRRIHCVDLFQEDLDGSALLSYPLNRQESVFLQNAKLPGT